MKKFSKSIGEKINEEPIIEISKEEKELEYIKCSILKLMDETLTIRTYGSVSPVLTVPTKIAGKEMFVEALIDFISDKSMKDQIKALESLKSTSKDWTIIDTQINSINESITLNKQSSHIQKIKNFLDKYSNIEEFNNILDKYVSRIKTGKNAYYRSICAEQMAGNPKYQKYSKSQLKNLSDKFLFRAKQLGFTK